MVCDEPPGCATQADGNYETESGKRPKADAEAKNPLNLLTDSINNLMTASFARTGKVVPA
jgi:hypothetical protein